MHQDIVRLRQILLDLLGHAAKFTEGGTVTLSAERRAAERGDSLAFRVADTGISMTPEQVARLFVRFRRADAPTTRRYGGTGPSLTLSRTFGH